MGSLGRVLAWLIPTPCGEEEPRGAALPVAGLVLPGKAALTYPDGVNLCDATQLPGNKHLCLLEDGQDTNKDNQLLRLCKKQNVKQQKLKILMYYRRHTECMQRFVGLVTERLLGMP